jgi:hypothetical protein
MQGKAAFGKKPQGNASKTVWSLAHLSVTKAAVQPSAGGVDDPLRSLLRVLACRHWGGKRPVQALEGCMASMWIGADKSSAWARTKKQCRGQNDWGARAGGNRRNQVQSSCKPSRGLRRAVRKNQMACSSTGHGVRSQSMPEQTPCEPLPIAKVVNPSKCQMILTYRIKVNFYISSSFKVTRSSHTARPSQPT